MRNVNLVRSFLKDQAGSDVPTDADVTQRLQSAEQGMRQMATLLRQWLQASHFATPATAVPKQNNDDDANGEVSQTASIGHVVEMAMRLATPQARDHGIALAAQIDPSVADIPAGPLYHAIANALRNAIDAIAQSPTPVDSPRIELVIFLDRDHLVIKIDDNGPGIGPEMLDKHGDCRIGETSKPDGHGLGLTLCRDTADSLGGTLRLTNRLPRGAKFTMRFPASALLA